jgi:hypothetical protein
MPIIHGYNAAVAAGTETIWYSDTVWVPPTAARVHELVSGDVKDDAAGVGARTVLVTGINGSGAVASEVVIMDGTTPVNTTGSYLHISSLRVLTAGSELDNAALITATAVSDATISAAIVAGMNVSNGAMLYAGAGQQFHVRSVTISASGLTDGATSIEVALVHKPAGGLLEKTHIACLWSGATATVTVPLDLLLQSTSWIRLDATSTDAAAIVAATINYAQLA